MAFMLYPHLHVPLILCLFAVLAGVVPVETGRASRKRGGWTDRVIGTARRLRIEVAWSKFQATIGSLRTA